MKFSCLSVPSIPGSILLRIQILQIVDHHQRNLEPESIVKIADIQTGLLLQLLDPVNQRVAVNEKLSGRLGYVQIVLKEAVDGRKRLCIQIIRYILTEHFVNKYIAQVGGKLIDQPSNAS